MNAPSRTLKLATDEGGFTFAELLVVIVLLAILSTILWGSLNGLLRARQTIEEKRHATRAAYYFLNRISSELLSALATPIVDPTNAKSGKASGGPSMIGKNSREGSADTDSITFVSATGAQAVFGGGGNRGAVQIHYFVSEQSAEDGALVLGERRNHLVLAREEYPAEETDQKKLRAQLIRYPITTDLASFNIRYFSDNRWQDEWEGKGANLPKAVEIGIKIYQANGQPLSFKTAVYLYAGS